MGICGVEEDEVTQVLNMFVDSDFNELKWNIDAANALLQRLKANNQQWSGADSYLCTFSRRYDSKHFFLVIHSKHFFCTTQVLVLSYCAYCLKIS